MAPFIDDRHLVPEPRRRHVLPLRLARGPRGGRRRRRHHLQAALQRRRRDDRRPGRRRASCRCPTLDAAARAEGVRADHRHHRRARAATAASRWRRGRRACWRPRPAASRPSRSSRDVAGRDRADPRPGVRGREAPRCASAASSPSRPTRVVSTSASARAAATAATSRNCLSVQPVDTEFGRKTQIHQTSLQHGLLVPGGRLPVVPHRRRRGEPTATAPATSTRSTVELPEPRQLVAGDDFTCACRASAAPAW